MAKKQKMSQLCEGLNIYPQVLQNVRVADKAEALANLMFRQPSNKLLQSWVIRDVYLCVSQVQSLLSVSWLRQRARKSARNMWICRCKIKIKVNAKDNTRNIQKLCENIMQLLLLSGFINE